MKRVVAVLLVMALTAGCASFNPRRYHPRRIVKPRAPYLGTRQDVQALCGCFRGETTFHDEDGILLPALGYTIAPLACLISLPVSAVVDTLRLPVDIPWGHEAQLNIEREWESRGHPR